MTIRHIAPLAALSVASFVILLAPPVSAAVPIVVSGAISPDLVVRRVSYADLDLASARDEITLGRRVGGAVKQVCREATGGNDGSLRVRTAFAHCGNKAWDGARPQIATAVQRARDIAMTGSSKLAARTIAITL